MRQNVRITPVEADRIERNQMSVRLELEKIREGLVEMAEEEVKAYREKAFANAEPPHYAVRVRDERASGRSVRIIWGEIKWAWRNAEAAQPKRARLFFDDLRTPPDGVYKPGYFRKAKQWEINLILETEGKLAVIRRGLRQVGQLMMRVPALEQVLVEVQGQPTADLLIQSGQLTE